MASVFITVCPACGATDFQPYITCTDFTTTQEQFTIQQCNQCSFLLTSPRPDDFDIGKYYESKSYISHTGKSSELFDSVYLFVRGFTLRWKTNIISKYKNGGTILDYGCGTGEFLSTCKKRGWNTFGVEPSLTANRKAKANSNLVIAKDLKELKGQKYDVITLWHVLEHVADLNEKLTALKRVLNKDGIILVAVPNHTSLDAEVYQNFWAAYDVPRHLWHFSKKTIHVLTSKAGLQLQQIKPMKLDAYYVSMLSERYKRGGHTISGVFNAILTAIKSNRAGKKEMNYSSLIYIFK